MKNWLSYTLAAAGAALVGYALVKPNDEAEGADAAPPESLDYNANLTVENAFNDDTVTGYDRGSSFQLTVRAVGNGQVLRRDAAQAFLQMVARAAQDGVTLVAGSGFRSMSKQMLLYAEYLARFKTAPTVAYPGTSNHQNGTAVDVADATGWRSIKYGTPEFAWLQGNAINFGWSWDEGKKVNEPWHWRYVG